MIFNPADVAAVLLVTRLLCALFAQRLVGESDEAADRIVVDVAIVFTVMIRDLLGDHGARSYQQKGGSKEAKISTPLCMTVENRGEMRGVQCDAPGSDGPCKPCPM